MTVQVSCASEEGSGTPVPALSIEVDDIEPPWRESKMQAFQSSMVQKVSLGKYEDSMSEIRFLMISRGIDYLQLKRLDNYHRNWLDCSCWSIFYNKFKPKSIE